MEPQVILLVFFSALMHAGWNLLARRESGGQARPPATGGTEGRFFARMLALVALVGLAPAAVSEALARSLSPKSWACVVASGACFGAYFFSLARAYGSSDFTVVYPTARALPILFVAAGDALRGRYPSAPGLAGIGLVTCGCFLTPLHSLREAAWRRYVNCTSLWLLVAAAATAGFTLLDKVGSEALRTKGPAAALRYGYVMYLVAWATQSALMRACRAGRFAPPGGDVGWKAPAVGAVLTFGGYVLVLWAYQIARQATYVFAFRQFSIVVGVVLAFWLYREKGLVVRLAGTLLITAGLVFIAIWGR